MGALNEVLWRLTGAHVRDVLLPGFLERDLGVSRHVSWPSEIYLELDVRLLRLASVASVGSHLIDTPPPITRIRCAMNGESDAERGVVRCVEFQLGSTLRLFLDPRWIPGIQLATGDAYDVWRQAERGDAEEFLWPPQAR